MIHDWSAKSKHCVVSCVHIVSYSMLRPSSIVLIEYYVWWMLSYTYMYSVFMICVPMRNAIIALHQLYIIIKFISYHHLSFCNFLCDFISLWFHRGFTFVWILVFYFHDCVVYFSALLYLIRELWRFVVLLILNQFV